MLLLRNKISFKMCSWGSNFGPELCLNRRIPLSRHLLSITLYICMDIRVCWLRIHQHHTKAAISTTLSMRFNSFWKTYIYYLLNNNPESLLLFIYCNNHQDTGKFEQNTHQDRLGDISRRCKSTSETRSPENENDETTCAHARRNRLRCTCVLVFVNVSSHFKFYE